MTAAPHRLFSRPLPVGNLLLVSRFTISNPSPKERLHRYSVKTFALVTFAKQRMDTGYR